MLERHADLKYLSRTSESTSEKYFIDLEIMQVKTALKETTQ